MIRGEGASKENPEDPELKQLLSDVAFNDALAKLVADAESAQINLRRLDSPGLGPRQAVEVHKRYHRRECEKAQLRIEIFRLPREIEELRRHWERASSPGARRHHDQRCMMLDASRAMGRSTETSLPKPPELEAKGKLDSALALLEQKERRLQQITTNDEQWNALVNATPAPQRLITQAPPPPRVLRGNWIPSKPKPVELPTSFPPGFPRPLVLKARVILADVIREFPDRSKLEALCKKLVSRYTELLCTGVSSALLKAYEAPDELNTIIHYVLVANCERENERFEIQQAVINSDEWHAMLKALLECQPNLEPPDGNATDSAKSSNPTRQRIDTFLEKMREHGHPISRKDIWQAAGYADATEFERFQREDSRVTAGSKAKFERILNMNPQEFVQKLEKLDSK